MNLGVADNTEINDASMSINLAESLAFGGLYLTDPVTGQTFLICVPDGLMQPPGCRSYTAMPCGCIEGIDFSPASVCYQTNTPPCTGGVGTVGGQRLTVRYADGITGDLQMFVTAVPLGYNAAGEPYDQVTNSNAVSSTSTSSASGSSRSLSGGGSGSGESFSFSQSRTVVRQQLALGKSSARVVSGGFYPTGVLEYTLSITVSANHTYRSMIVKDIPSGNHLFYIEREFF